jgi:hypothetical protein
MAKKLDTTSNLGHFGQIVCTADFVSGNVGKTLASSGGLFTSQQAIGELLLPLCGVELQHWRSRGTLDRDALFSFS